ncbi:MAG: hypothetical protein ACRYHQ_08765 [Janthinobacterium lividum]
MLESVASSVSHRLLESNLVHPLSLSDDVCWATVALLFRHGDVSAASAASGLSVDCLTKRMRIARKRFPGVLPVGGTGAGWCKGRLPKRPAPAAITAPAPAKVAAPPKVAAPAAPTADPLDARREADVAHHLRLRVAGLERDLIAQQDWRRKMDVLSSAVIAPANWPAPAIAKRSNLLIPMLFTSDFQVGEVIRPDEIDGMNSYDQHIFRARYEAMIEKTIRLASENTGATAFPHAIYLRGGDAISGEIHEELAQTNDLSSIPAVRAVLQAEREGIKRLVDKFGKVRVVSIPGNHGRTTFKSHAKGYTERSYETLLAWWLQSSFEDNSKVSFFTPASGDAMFKVFNWNILLSHGDRMGSRGGAGFVGPSATIARGHRKLYDNWASTGRPADLILTGHLHTSLKLERGYANGSLAGYSEYARDLRATPDAAKQWLLMLHEREMVSHQFELKLSPPPRRTLMAPED